MDQRKVFYKDNISAGGGAGLAAVFNAPIAGLFFTIEELLHTTTPVVMGVVAVTTFWSDAWGVVFNWLGVDKENGDSMVSMVSRFTQSTM